ncbi:MAG: hypothetical protein AB1567_05945 [bacterium]
MKKLLLAGIGIMLAGSVWAASGDQPVKLNSVNTAATVTVYAIDLDIRDLSSAQDSVSAVQSGTWVIATVTAIANNVTVEATNFDIRDLSSAQDSVAAVQSGTWVIATVTAIAGEVTLGASTNNIGDVDVLTLPSIPAGANLIGSVTILGSTQVPIKTDANGQIYAITSPESGTNIKKTFVFSNIATGSWIEVGSYTVTTGKSLKIYKAKVTGRHALDFKISNGTAEQDIRMATSPSDGNDDNGDDRPIINTAGTIIRCYVQAETATNDGTVSFNGFEY